MTDNPLWKNAYKMKLGDIIFTAPNSNQFERLTRVPGGWIYTHGNLSATTSAFIPYDLEFLKP